MSSELSDSEETQDWLADCLTNEESDGDNAEGENNVTKADDKTADERKGTYNRLRNASKPHSTPLTLKWLEENYEIADGVCIPRSTLYVHYLDFCEKNDTQPVNAASFGKIIRQQFQQLTTRRLGTRGQSKYHYYGIAVREESSYYEVMYSAKGVQSSTDGKKDTCKQIIAYSPRSKLGTLLPEFPDVTEVKLPPGVSEDKVLTFMMMYRTHCQRILDTVIRANFDEVQSFLLHFWQGMPDHIKSILDSPVLVTLVGVCDSILYRAIANVLMPTVLQPLPESLTHVIRKFSRQLDDWLIIALESLSEKLQRIKFDLARRFSQVLKRQTSLNHLCQAARTVINSSEITSQMLDDWLNVDLNSIVKQTLYTMDSYSDSEHNTIVKLTREFETLLEDQAPIESYIAWLDSMVEHCVVQTSKGQVGSLRRTARQFLLMWSCFGTRVIRDMTLHSAPSFGSFHLLHLMFDEYVLYLVENLHSQERAAELMRALKGDNSTDAIENILELDSHGLKDRLPKPNIVSMETGNQNGDRVPLCNQDPDLINQMLGRSENVSEFIPSINAEPSGFVPYQSYSYRETPSNGSRSNVSTYSTPFPPFPSFGPPLYSSRTSSSRTHTPNVTFPNYQHGGCQESATYLGASIMDKIPSLANNATSQSSLTCDWNVLTSSTSSGEYCDGAANNRTLADNRLCAQNRHPGPSTTSMEPNVNMIRPSGMAESLYQQEFSPPDRDLTHQASGMQTSYQTSHSEGVFPKRNSLVNQSTKRKHETDIPAVQYKQDVHVMDMYQFGMAPSLL